MCVCVCVCACACVCVCMHGCACLSACAYVRDLKIREIHVSVLSIMISIQRFMICFNDIIIVINILSQYTSIYIYHIEGNFGTLKYW